VLDKDNNNDDVEVNSVEDGNTDDYDNQLPAGDELYASELRLSGVDDSSTDDQSHSLDDRHVITSPAHLVTSLQVRLFRACFDNWNENVNWNDKKTKTI